MRQQSKASKRSQESQVEEKETGNRYCLLSEHRVKSDVEWMNAEQMWKSGGTEEQKK